MSTKPTPEEMGRNLEDFAEDAKLEEEAKRLGTRTKAEVAARSNLSEENRQRARALGQRAADAFAEAKAKEGPRAVHASDAPRPPPSRGMRWGLPLGIAAGFAAVAAVEGQAILAWLQGPVTPPPMHDAGPGQDRARELVAEAREECRVGRYAECVVKLNQAERIDPALERDPAAVELRAGAEAKLRDEAMKAVDGGATIQPQK